MYRSLVVLALALGIALPSFAMAQSSGNGLLSVYVQVIAPSGNQVQRTPADFQVTVSGSNPSPATFYGSQSGVSVSLNPGTYSVTSTGNVFGYTASYSQGCNGTMSAGATALCVITMSAYYNYPYPSPYPYPQYPHQPLRCEPQGQTVGLRQNATFRAVGGVGGTYNWRAESRDYANAGPTFTVSFDNSGTKLVTVTNATETATCTVTVNNTYYPVLPTNPVYPYPQNPTLYPTYYPRLPNTGVEPLQAAQIAFAIALLGLAASVAAPHIRKAFAIVTR